MPYRPHTRYPQPYIRQSLTKLMELGFKRSDHEADGWWRAKLYESVRNRGNESERAGRSAESRRVNTAEEHDNHAEKRDVDTPDGFRYAIQVVLPSESWHSQVTERHAGIPVSLT